MKKLFKYFTESKAELKKVIWPNKKETTNYTLLIITISLGIALFFAILDYVLTLGLEQLLK